MFHLGALIDQKKMRHISELSSAAVSAILDFSWNFSLFYNIFKIINLTIAFIKIEECKISYKKRSIDF